MDASMHHYLGIKNLGCSAWLSGMQMDSTKDRYTHAKGSPVSGAAAADMADPKRGLSPDGSRTPATASTPRRRQRSGDAARLSLGLAEAPTLRARLGRLLRENEADSDDVALTARVLALLQEPRDLGPTRARTRGPLSAGTGSWGAGSIIHASLAKPGGPVHLHEILPAKETHCERVDPELERAQIRHSDTLDGAMQSRLLQVKV